MANCGRCATPLTGRRKVCDDCKAKRIGSGSAEPKMRRARRSAVPEGLHPRGQALWSSLKCEQGTATGELALEACRLADRMNELDRIIAGKGVLQLMQFRLDAVDWDGEENVNVTVSFQSVLSEARMQAATFKDLLKDLRVAKAAAATAPGGVGPAAPTPAPVVKSGIDSLAARRAARVAASS